MKNYKFLIKYIKKTKKSLFIWMGVTIIFMLLHASATIVWGYAIESIADLDFNKFLYLGLFTQGIYIFGCLLDTVRNYAYINVETKFANEVMNDLYEKMINLPCIAYEKMGVGEIVNRLTGDCKTVIETAASLFKLLVKTLIVIAIIIFSFFIHYLIGCLFILLGITIFLITHYYLPIIKKREKQMKDISDKYLKEVNETFVGIREVKSLGIKNSTMKSVKKKFSDYFLINVKSRKKETNFYDLNNIVFYVYQLIIILVAGYLMYEGNFGFAIFSIVLNCIWRIDEVVSGLSDFGVRYSKVVVSLNRIDEILNNKLYLDEKFGTFVNDNPRGFIEFKNVYFKYSDDEDYIINNMNISFEPNKKIAIVGRSGNGKSTMFNLLSRFFDVSEGQIEIDGKNIKEYNEKSLRNLVSVIRQNPYMFNKTIIDNFRIIDKNLSLVKIREACKKACIDDYIMSLPNKYETMIGEGGVNLSGGQKQRVAIARSLLNNAKIFLFDEATSALDNESQKYIKKTINELIKEHTVIIIAHRLSTVSDADTIYVVEKGEVESKGTKNELLKTSSIFKELYKEETA